MIFLKRFNEIVNNFSSFNGFRLETRGKIYAWLYSYNIVIASRLSRHGDPSAESSRYFVGGCHGFQRKPRNDTSVA